MPLEIDSTNLAYCAALFDGEGNIRCCVCRHKWKPSEVRMIRLGIKMTDLEPLEKFKSFIGMGKILGPYREKRWPAHYKSIYIYLVQDFETAQAVIALVWKWLSAPKRRQASVALKGYLALGGTLNQEN
jgi:hypothetical protein